MSLPPPLEIAVAASGRGSNVGADDIEATRSRSRAEAHRIHPAPVHLFTRHLCTRTRVSRDGRRVDIRETA